MRQVEGLAGAIFAIVELLALTCLTQSTTLLSTTPLVAAARGQHMEIVRALLDRGAKPNTGTCTGLPLSRLPQTNGIGVTPLLIAAKRGSEAIVKLLLERGANPNLADFRGYTPIHSAASKSHIYIIRLLIQAGADPSPGRNICGTTPLHMALNNNDQSEFGIG